MTSLELHIKNSKDLLRHLSATPEQKKSWQDRIEYIEHYSKEMKYGTEQSSK